MIASIYTKYLAKFMPKLQRLIEKVNGQRDGDSKLTYLHKTMLRKEYAADNKWESTSVNTTYVAADMVSMDSPLPVKKRDSMSSANGKLPKIGMAKQLKESDMTTIRIMEAQGGQATRISQKLAQDPIACANGIDERNELNFLKGFCEGVVGIKSEDAENALLRLNFGYLPENQFGSTKKGVIVLQDIFDIIDKADEDGNTILHIAISKKTFDELRKTQEAKELVAQWQGRTFDEDTVLPVPSAGNFKSAFEDETNGVDFNIINRTIIIEENGKRTPFKPWNNNRLVFYCADEVGTLVYGRLAEQDNHVEGVLYSEIDDYKLIARFRETNPLRETTTGQAFVAPIIEDVDQIYVLDISEGQEVDEDSELTDTEDAYITVWGNKYQKQGFVEALEAIRGAKLRSTTDASVITAVNKLSKADESKLEEIVAEFISD